MHHYLSSLSLQRSGFLSAELTPFVCRLLDLPSVDTWWVVEMYGCKFQFEQLPDGGYSNKWDLLGWRIEYAPPGAVLAHVGISIEYGLGDFPAHDQFRSVQQRSVARSSDSVSISESSESSESEQYEMETDNSSAEESFENA